MERVRLSSSGKEVYKDEPDNPYNLTGTIDRTATPWDDEFTVIVDWDNGERNGYRPFDLEFD